MPQQGLFSVTKRSTCTAAGPGAGAPEYAVPGWGVRNGLNRFSFPLLYHALANGPDPLNHRSIRPHYQRCMQLDLQYVTLIACYAWRS